MNVSKNVVLKVIKFDNLIPTNISHNLSYIRVFNIYSRFYNCEFVCILQ